MPERLCIEYIAEAREAGADVRNYSAVDFIVVNDGTASGVDYHDALSGSRHHADAPLIVNAAGPWVDAVLEATGEPLRPRLGPTKGSHLVLDLQSRGPQHAVLASARSDGRQIFVIPWLGHHILGTTDVRVTSDPESVTTEDWEVEYLLSEAAHLLPGIGVERHNILYAYCGVRPLPHQPQETLEGAIPRRHYLIDHKREGVRGLLSIVGGQLTTAEHTAQAIVRAARRAIGAPPHSGRPRGLPSREPGRISFPSPIARDHLDQLYGPRAADVAAFAAGQPELMEPLSPFHPDIGAQVAYALQHEGARTVGDVLLRRTAVGLTHDQGRSAAPRVAAIMGDRLSWGETQRRAAVHDYEHELQHRFTLMAGAPRPDEDEHASRQQA
jgi:glycerol-3-phosphate dehydrogenase